MVSKIEMILLFMSISPQCRFFIFAKKESASDTRRLFFLWAGKLLPASRECADFNTYPRCSLRAWRAFFYKTENRIRLREHASPPLRALGVHRALGAPRLTSYKYIVGCAIYQNYVVADFVN